MINCRSLRRFGVEIEINTPTGIIQRPNASKGEIAHGSESVARIVKSVTGKCVRILSYKEVSNNNYWIVKPDNSCGIEINSPVLKGWSGLSTLMRVVDNLAKKYHPLPDERCSFHVHVNISDLTREQLASVIAWYIKCEHLFFDAMLPHRKNNRYCQLIGSSDLFNSRTYDVLNPDDIINRMGISKYMSFNAFHFSNGGGFSGIHTRKKTVEFRIMGNDGCCDPWVVKNWVRLLLHFVDTTKNLPLPKPYKKGDSMSYLLWLNPRDVLYNVLLFNKPLSPGMKQVFYWFMQRIYHYGYDLGLSGIWSNEGRRACREEFIDILNEIDIDRNFVPSEEDLYGIEYSQ